jgi:predicted metalloendopeptidase
MHGQQETIQLKHVLEYTRGTLRRIEDLPIVLARLAHYGFTSPFVLSIEKHPTQPTMIPLLRVDSFNPRLTRANISSIMSDSMGIKSRRVWKIISQLRAWHITSEPNHYLDYISNGDFDKDVYTFSQLKDMTVGMDHFWTEYLRELDGHGLDAMRNKDEPFWMFNKPYFRELLGNLKEFTLQEWQDYVEFCVRESNDHFFPQLQSNVYFKQHDKQPFGSSVFLEHRMKRKPLGSSGANEALCADVVHKLLPGVVAKEFLHRYFDNEEDIRRQITEVVTNVRDTFVQVVQETEWMDEQTKEEALNKLQNIIVRVIHPNAFGEEPFAERISQNQWLRNLNMIRKYRTERNIALWKSRDPLDRDVIQRFGLPLSEVNAYFSPTTNSITVFAGILRPPFYDSQFSLDAVYARVASIVGHEMSHCLDNHGRLWDQLGLFRDWWTPHSKQQFDDHAQCVVDEYPAPSGCDNPEYGSQTLGEDISDINGVLLAYRAYFENTEEGRTKNRHDKQYWWQMFAQMWCETLEQEHLCNRVQNDVHAVGEMRVDKTLRQLHMFGKDYMCKNTDEMVNSEACIMFGENKG